MHTYYTDVPMIKVQRYFGPRLLTGEVQQLPSGAIYRRATPRGVLGLFLMIGFWLLDERKPTHLLLASVPIVVLFWVLMTQGLDVFIESPILKRGRESMPYDHAIMLGQALVKHGLIARERSENFQKLKEDFAHG